MLPERNPQLPDSINNADRHPLRDFLWLAGGLLLIVVILTIALALSARWLAPLLPYEWERQWLSREIQSAPTPEEEALQQLLARLLKAQDQALPVTLHWLADEPMPNAFALPGGHILITAGLLKQVSSENALAMVLAHEYAHVELRHPLTGALEQLSVNALLSLFSAPGASVLSQNSGLLTLLSFSRDMESDADQRALEILTAYYGHTQGAAEFFEHMQQQQDSPAWSLVFRTHPLTRDRLARIAGATSTATEPVLTPLPAALQPDKRP